AAAVLDPPNYRHCSSQCRVRVNATDDAARAGLWPATIAARARLRTVHQQKPFCLFDGDGIWTVAGTGFGRRCAPGPGLDLSFGAAADLGGSGLFEFSRWHSGDDCPVSRRALTVSVRRPRKQIQPKPDWAFGS